jgi:hypothetical protein
MSDVHVGPLPLWVHLPAVCLERRWERYGNYSKWMATMFLVDLNLRVGTRVTADFIQTK